MVELGDASGDLNAKPASPRLGSFDFGRRRQAPRRRTEVAPPATVRRLSLYVRELEVFAESARPTISSRALGDALRLADAQVRKDLAYFGQFGHSGVGYRVSDLLAKLRHVLGTDRRWGVALVGAGNLGRALACHAGFISRGFHVVAAFDTDPTKVGQPLCGDLTTESVDDLYARVTQLELKLAILAVPPEPAQAVADLLVRAGVTGILSFAPVSLSVPDHVTLTSIDLASSLEQLAFTLHHEGA